MLFPLHTVFRDVNSDQTIRFFPGTEGYKFIWQSPGTDKHGTYQFLDDQLELSFNYAREETYGFTILEREGDVVISFRLKDRFGREIDFRKV